MGDGSLCIAIQVVVNPNPRVLAENHVCCLVCEIEDGMYNRCRFCSIVLDKMYGLVGVV